MISFFVDVVISCLHFGEFDHYIICIHQGDTCCGMGTHYRSVFCICGVHIVFCVQRMTVHWYFLLSNQDRRMWKSISTFSRCVNWLNICFSISQSNRVSFHFRCCLYNHAYAPENEYLSHSAENQCEKECWTILSFR